jgi:hypothetical protein
MSMVYSLIKRAIPVAISGVDDHVPW